MLLTSGFSLPSFDGKLRAFRTYKPVAEHVGAVSGYKFKNDGTRFWVASAPAAASRNIYTVLPDGTMTAFTTSNATTLAPYMNLSAADASRCISFVRAQPLGPFVDPRRRSWIRRRSIRRRTRNIRVFGGQQRPAHVIWVGGNDGMMHAIDARLGVEVWAFVPFNLLPKLKALPTASRSAPSIFSPTAPRRSPTSESALRARAGPPAGARTCSSAKGRAARSIRPST